LRSQKSPAREGVSGGLQRKGYSRSQHLARRESPDANTTGDEERVCVHGMGWKQENKAIGQQQQQKMISQQQMRTSQHIQNTETLMLTKIKPLDAVFNIPG
jgi:hypothetical protein